MLRELEELIQKEAELVSSEEITTALKIASYGHIGAGLLGTGIGALGLAALTRQERENQANKATAKALLAGLGGAGAGYLYAAGLPSSSSGEYMGFDADTELSPEDMKDIWR